MSEKEITLDKEINVTNVCKMLDLNDGIADNNKDTVNDSPLHRTRNAAAKTVRNTFDKASRVLFAKSKNENDETVEKDTVTTVINSVVRVVTELVGKVAAQGASIKELFESIAKERTSKDRVIEDLKIKHDALEQKLKAEKENLENRVMENRNIINDLQNRVTNESNNDKLRAVEKECDEARQREMKGTLIITSPERGNIKTVAVKRVLYWPQTNTWGPEGDMDMVLRLIYMKYGVRIPWTDVSACHRFGKKESHSYVLRIWNRKPFSAWELLTKAMLTGKETSRQNIFVNHMLTSRRTEMSKMVRQAKKDSLITKYSVDQNGKIFVIKTGDTNYTEMKCIEDIENLGETS